MASNGKKFSREELKSHNGKDQSTVYIAHEDNVYDVSESKLWKTGMHMKRHPAGSDLTEELSAAPHGPEVLERMPQVGSLEPEADPMDAHVPSFLLKIFQMVPMLRRHPHPMTVHFPLAFCMVVPLFNLLYLISGILSFEETAFYMLVLSVIGTMMAGVTGPYTWWLNYGAKLTGNIKVKMAASVLLSLLLLVGLVWRVWVPDVLIVQGTSAWIYLFLTFSYPMLVAILGWFGAKMTFPH